MGVTSVRIQARLSQRLDEVSSRLHRSKSSIINQAVEAFLDQQQLEEQRWQDTLAALESVRQGRLVTADAAHAWVESWGTEAETSAPEMDQ